MRSRILIYLPLLLSISPIFGQTPEPTTIDLEEAKIIVDSLDRQFSKHFHDGDSLALYHMYAKGATFGNRKGNDILLAWGEQIRDAIKNDTRNFLFTTTSLSTDSEFLVELGKYELKNSEGVIKGDGKYLLVWKKEDGHWKIYRDMGL